MKLGGRRQRNAAGYITTEHALVKRVCKRK